MPGPGKSARWIRGHHRSRPDPHLGRGRHRQTRRTGHGLHGAARLRPGPLVPIVQRGQQRPPWDRPRPARGPVGVLVAFATGALIVDERSDDPVIEQVGVAPGRVGGCQGRCVASFSYCGNASSPSAVFWAAVGLVVGGAAGLAGAAWRARPGSAVEATAAGAIGLALVAEGIGRLDFGWFHSARQVSHLGARWLVAAGLALPVLLTRGRPAGVVAAITVALLAAPVAALVVVASHGLGLA